MFGYVYSKDYGWNPLKFLLKGKNFYKERNRWEESIKSSTHISNTNLKYAHIINDINKNY